MSMQKQKSTVSTVSETPQDVANRLLLRHQAKRAAQQSKPACQVANTHA